MKRTRHEHIHATLNQYLKRRAYTDGEVSQKRECKHCKSLELLAVDNLVKAESGMDDILSYSSISGDATAYDQQFHRLKHFIKDAVEPHRTELKEVLYPMFVHVYLELLCNGHKMPAHKFYARHSGLAADEEERRPFMEALIKLGGQSDIAQHREASEFRDHKYNLCLTGDSLQYLMRHLKVDDNMIMLQIFNQHFKVILHTDNKPNLELLTDQNGNKSHSSSLSPSPPKKHTRDEVSLNLLQECIKRVRDGPPCLPSICFYTFLNAYQGLICSVISPDNTVISGGFEDSSIKLWSLAPKKLSTAPSTCNPSHVLLGSQYEDESEDEITRVTMREQETVCLRGHCGSVFKTCFSHDTKYLLSCSEDTTVRLWDLNTHTNVVCYRGHAYPVWDIDVSPVGGNFVSCSHDHTAKLWSTDRLFPLRSYIGHSYDVDCIQFHPNSNYVATGSSDKTVRLWSAQEGKSVRLLQGHRSGVLSVAFSPNGKYLASAGEDRRIRVWDLGSGQLYKEFKGHTDTVYALSFNRDGSLLASGGLDCCIRIWDTRKGSNTCHGNTALTDGHTSSELLGAFPTKSATVNFLRYADCNLLQAAGPI
ncbi:TAF5-like RNA polymerase II p300/CBP-associated factor-associated factor 65 kDa subunit 5L [Liolophura sinensis]|uniref:TAF5-like RNA polymerase II p300/CBP-associated factor-associated factor 65 kDa subunit 5L n=1 Tax=Liolophura sinensis TaxID=3198878 RepID=UPI0031598C76